MEHDSKILDDSKELNVVAMLLSLLPNHPEVALLSNAFVLLSKFNSITIICSGMAW
jgi:hypothetical protein